MKIAIISDIHGYSIALGRVLDAIHAEPGVDRIIAAGDLCEGGPDPVGALRLLDEHHVECIQGNTDRDLGNATRGSASARWTSDQIGSAGIEALASLPFDIRVSPPGGSSPEDDLLIVHANPHDQDQHLNPSFTDEQLRNIIGETPAAVLAFGHIHIAYVRSLDGMTLIDVSAVGNPKDKDLRSKWGLATWHDTERSWTVELCHVDYPVQETLLQIEASGMPNPRKVTRKLLNASYED
jgi:predicted phosphodiesterase